MRTQAEKKKSSYREPLILIAFVIVGAILGLTLGEKASVLYPIGQIWLNLLFVLLVPLIFFSISSSIANIADTKRVGKLLVLTIGIFVVTAAIAGVYMFAVTGIFGVDTSIQLDPSEVPLPLPRIVSARRSSTPSPSATSHWSSPEDIFWL